MTDKLRAMLEEAVLQLEYLNEKEQRGTTNAVITRARAALAAAPQPASSCPPPQHGGDTYYTKDKTAEWWVGLTDEQFAWELTCAAQDLNDTGLGDDLDKWMPHQVMLADAAKRIKRLSAAPQPKVIGKLGWGSEMAAPQPSPVNREALVKLIDDELPWDLYGTAFAERIANALLARGLRLTGGEETMAWAVVMEVGGPIPREVYPTLSEAKEAASLYGGRPVRVAIRVVEGGDDAA